MFYRLLSHHPYFVIGHIFIAILLYLFGMSNLLILIIFLSIILIIFFGVYDNNKNNYNKETHFTINFGIFLFSTIFIIIIIFKYFNFEPYQTSEFIKNKEYVYSINTAGATIYFIDKNNKIEKEISLTTYQFNKLIHIKNYEIQIVNSYNNWNQQISIEEIKIKDLDET